MNKLQIKKALIASIIAMVLANPEFVSADENIMKEYLEKELDFYKSHPEEIEKDAEKFETIIDPRGKLYKKIVSKSIKDINNEFADLAYIPVTSIGNASSNGDGISTMNFDFDRNGIGYKTVAVVGVKSGAKYPFAVAEYDDETKSIGNIIGWYKDEDVYARFDNYANVIEMPISKYVTHGNIFDFDVDNKGNLINHSYTLPYSYTPLTDNYEYGIRIDYSEKAKEGYHSNYQTGLYVSEKLESNRAKLDEKNLKLVQKFNIKNK